MKTIRTFLAIGLIAMAVTSCQKKEKVVDNQPVRVKTITVTKGNVDAGVSYPGVIEASSGTALSFKVAGTLTQLAVNEGQKVTKGQLIARLSDATLRNNYEIAQAALATAQDTYDRMKQLHDANAIPEMKWVEVQNALRAAKSSCSIAKEALDDTAIYAPFSGYVSEKLADAGSNVAPGLPVVKLVEISPVKASVSVGENEIRSFTPGVSATITADALPGVTLNGKLTERGVSADPFSRTYTMKFTADNPDGRLLPGMLCSVTLTDATSVEAFSVPMACVMLDNKNNTFVWAVSNGKAVKKEITLGSFTAGDGVIVKAGLADNDSIIVSGQQKVSEGMAVESVNE